MSRLPTPKGVWWAVAMVCVMIPFVTYAQHLSSARGIALGGFTSMSTGVPSLDWNPAGLVSTKDWEFNVSNYFTIGLGSGTLSLHSANIAKRFLDDQAAALRYSPGKGIDFIVPRTFIISDSNFSFATTFDQKISYQELYALGYAYRLSDGVTLGVGTRFLQQKVNDTKYFFDNPPTISSQVVEYIGASWAVDWGLLWKSTSDWTFGLVAKNLFRITEAELPDEVLQYRVSPPKTLRAGIGYAGVKNFLLGLDYDTEKRSAAGLEWNPQNNIFIRTGVYANGSASPIVDAVAIGAGVTYDFLQLDVSYLRFISQENRRGIIDAAAFHPGLLRDIEFNEFTSDRISITLKANLGRTRESFARIEYVEMLSDVFPSSPGVYAYRPVGKARVRNTSGKPLEAKVSFYIDRVMDSPTETRSFTLAPDETKEVPFYAIFNDFLRAVGSAAFREGTVYVNAAPAEGFDDRYQTRVLIRGRNDWNGDVTHLRYFVTPEDPDVFKWTRAALNASSEQLDSVDTAIRGFAKAKILFNEFSKRLSYVNDPKSSQDFVQYPSETLSLHGGDCDDLTVAFSTILASVGMSTAFVDVIPPQKPDQSHIYMMFDTGVKAPDASKISDNPKRYMLRKNEKGIETAWIPVETTVTRKGFDEAWSVGAKEYFEDVELGLGIIKGWVRVFDYQIVF